MQIRKFSLPFLPGAVGIRGAMLIFAVPLLKSNSSGIVLQL